MKSKCKRVTDYLIKCNNESAEKVLYIVGIFSFVWIGMIAIGTQLANHYLGYHFGICFFSKFTGFYCPGCGGTRAIIYLLHGNILKSIQYNAFSTYLTIFYVIFMGSHTLFYFTKGKIKGLKFRPWFLYVGIVILIMQWLIKNILVLFFDIHII